MQRSERMKEDFYLKKLIKLNKSYEVEKFGEINLKQNYVPFVGTPKKHPRDKKILILLTDPFVENKEFYEFSIDSIVKLEELETVTSEYGESAMKVRVWVKKGMLAFKTEPFVINWKNL